MVETGEMTGGKENIPQPDSKDVIKVYNKGYNSKYSKKFSNKERYQ